MIVALIKKAEELLRSNTVNVIYGYGEGSTPERTRPVFITKPEDVNKLTWNKYCVYNLTTYLKRQEARKLGKPAIVVKGCDAKTIIVLIKESQIKREDVYILGVTCNGVGEPLATKCKACDVHTPRIYDELIGEKIENNEISFDERYAELEEYEKLSEKDKWEFWQKQFAKCIKCYACSSICPLCFCDRCIVDKNQPQWIDPSAHPRGNISWNVTRAYHLAGRCINCEECQRVCPVGIPLNLLNKKLAKETERNFKYRAGYKIDDELAMATYNEKDNQDFIK
ncbi:MAG: 4Fe-4S dicluster domain-containing protein [Candidatus Scalinduaceae bacterium]